MSRRSLWSMLEEFHTGTVPQVWRSHLGDGFEALRQAWLRPLGLATHVQCASCGCSHRLIPEPGQSTPSWRGVCQCDSAGCEDILVSQREITRWGLDVARIGAALCRGMGIEPRTAAVDIPGTRQMGAWSAEALPVLLSFHDSRSSFEQAVARTCLLLRQRFYLFTPTTEFWTAQTQAAIAAHPGQCLSLEHLAVIDGDGVLSCLKTGEELFCEACTNAVSEREDKARELFSLVRRIDGEMKLKPPGLLTVLRMHFIEKLSVREVAKKSRCSRATIVNRLRMLSERTGMTASLLTACALGLEATHGPEKDPRARVLRPRSAILEEQDEED